MTPSLGIFARHFRSAPFARPFVKNWSDRAKNYRELTKKFWLYP